MNSRVITWREVFAAAPSGMKTVTTLSEVFPDGIPVMQNAGKRAHPDWSNPAYAQNIHILIMSDVDLDQGITL